MATRVHPTFVKGLTIAVALTLMSGFVFYRHRGGSPSPRTMMSAAPIDSPETEGGMKQVRIDSFYMDQSMPSSKSGMIVPPDHPAFQQPWIWVDSSRAAPSLTSSRSGIAFPDEDANEERGSEHIRVDSSPKLPDIHRTDQRTMFSSSKSLTPVFEPPSMVNDSVVEELKTQDTPK